MLMSGQEKSPQVDDYVGFEWWPDPESNWGHKDFQSSALPTELSGLVGEGGINDL